MSAEPKTLWPDMTGEQWLHVERTRRGGTWSVSGARGTEEALTRGAGGWDSFMALVSRVNLGAVIKSNFQKMGSGPTYDSLVKMVNYSVFHRDRKLFSPCNNSIENCQHVILKYPNMSFLAIFDIANPVQYGDSC